MKLKLYHALSASIAACALFSCSMHEKPKLNSETFYMDTPASSWYEALPLGNGRIGAMVFGGVNEEFIQIKQSIYQS